VLTESSAILDLGHVKFVESPPSCHHHHSTRRSVGSRKNDLGVRNSEDQVTVT
jgi:hypothetical protein